MSRRNITLTNGLSYSREALWSRFFGDQTPNDFLLANQELDATESVRNAIYGHMLEAIPTGHPDDELFDDIVDMLTDYVEWIES